MAGVPADTKHDGPDVVRPWRWCFVAALALVIAQTVALCGIWLDGMMRVRDTASRLRQVELDIAALMMLAGDLQDKDKRLDAVDRATAEWMLEASKHGTKRATDRGNR